jgi:hypothetical protein
MQDKKLMNTINATYQRCVDENIGLSMHYIRYICKESIIPTCKIGNKYLINWNILMNFLNGIQQEEEPSDVLIDTPMDTPNFDSLRSNKCKSKS